MTPPTSGPSQPATDLPRCPQCGAPNPFNSAGHQTSPMMKARKALDTLLVWADAVMDNEEHDRQLLLEKVLNRLGVICAELVEAERAGLRVEQAALAKRDATVFQVGVHLRGGDPS